MSAGTQKPEWLKKLGVTTAQLDHCPKRGLAPFRYEDSELVKAVLADPTFFPWLTNKIQSVMVFDEGTKRWTGKYAGQDPEQAFANEPSEPKKKMSAFEFLRRRKEGRARHAAAKRAARVAQIAALVPELGAMTKANRATYAARMGCGVPAAERGWRYYTEANRATA